ncbi:DUF4974 domain-containing protein [Rufibacter immobilis]|uniref:DUF4974 domain-containing protein n=1 Tax=Rufibacter immobilis TaxID=1348778 RepID=A0A3M9MPK9_9BACT|nr:FecR domain-containing protein [Rufibacter immobilis]RNI27449.1 DUF4974 domain-containing protein [Rufibacter immobilis]
MTKPILETHEGPEWVLMAKALRGELSDSEQQTFTAWLNENDSHSQQWANALEVWDEVGEEQNHTFEPNVEAAWSKFCAKAEITPTSKVIPIHQANTAATEPAPQEASHFPWNTLYKYAAAFVLAAGLAWLGYLQFNSSPAWTQIATAAGERHLIYLPDSSQVTLNENSTLRYQTAFRGSERKVELIGEGFFEVRKNPAQPFVIKSGNAQTTVLGTSFNVKAPKGTSDVSVAVVTGKVAFASLQNQKQVILTPGFTGVLAADGSLGKEQTQRTAQPDWQALVFQNTSISEVAKQLGEYFNVSIQVPNKGVQQCTFTGTFANPELKEILSILEISSDLKVKAEAGSYTLEGTGCN